MQPDLELVAVRRDESFKAWYHGYPYRTVRWHFHPEYEIHLIVATTGKMFVGDHISSFAPGNLVLLGPNLPHNWVSDVPEGETVEQRNLVLQFGQEFVSHCMESFPEWRQVEALLAAFAPRRVVRCANQRGDPAAVSRIAGRAWLAPPRAVHVDARSPDEC